MSTPVPLRCSTGAEGWRLCGGTFQTPPGPEGSNGKVWFPGVAARWASSPFGNRAEQALRRWDSRALSHRRCRYEG